MSWQHRAAEDFFRFGSRAEGDAVQTQLDPTKSTVAKYSTMSEAQHARLGQSQDPARIAVAPTSSVTCQNCQSQVAIPVHYKEIDGKDGKYSAKSQSVTSPKFRFCPPEIQMGADFPLVRARKLQRARRELVAYSAILVTALILFTISCSKCITLISFISTNIVELMKILVILYMQIPHWNSAQVEANVYTFCMWQYCIPTIASSSLYVYMTVTMPRQQADCPDTPKSPISKVSEVDKPHSKILTLKPILGEQRSMGKTGQPVLPPIFTRRSQPTYPRAPSSISLGMTMTTEGRRGGASEADHRMSDNNSTVYLPRFQTIVRGHSIVKRWVGETTSAQEHIKAPPRYAVSANVAKGNKTKGKSFGPVSQSMSWLEIDDQDEQ